MAGECITPDVASDFASRDVNRIVGKIGEVLARKSPWMDVLGGGTLPNVSEVVRSVVEEQASLGQSLASPSFSADASLCGTAGQLAQVGATEYQYQLMSVRGRGPRVCVNTTRTAFKGSYILAQLALEKKILQFTNADIRYQLLSLSGVKAVCNAHYSFDNMLSGGSQQISVPFNNFLPNAPVSFKFLWRLASTLREDFLVDAFESDTTTMFKWIGSVEGIERFREYLDVREDLRAFVTGHYTIGEKSLNSYAFQGPWRNIGFGIDSQPLRFNQVDANGKPILIEPEIAVATTRGVAARINPAWRTALYEIGFLIGANSFERLVPESYTGEGTFKYAPQLAMGKLQWTYFRDNDCNLFGDYGQHIYQISRAYRPIRPHAVVPVMYQRCPGDTGLLSCQSSLSGL